MFNIVKCLMPFREQSSEYIHESCGQNVCEKKEKGEKEKVSRHNRHIKC